MVTRIGTKEKPLQGPVFVRNRRSGEFYYYEPVAWKKSPWYAANVLTISAFPASIKTLSITGADGKSYSSGAVYGGVNRTHLSFTLPTPEKLNKREQLEITALLVNGAVMTFTAYVAPASKQKIEACAKTVEPWPLKGEVGDYGWDQTGE